MLNTDPVPTALLRTVTGFTQLLNSHRVLGKHARAFIISEKNSGLEILISVLRIIKLMSEWQRVFKHLS